MGGLYLNSEHIENIIQLYLSDYYIKNAIIP